MYTVLEQESTLEDVSTIQNISGLTYAKTPTEIENSGIICS